MKIRTNALAGIALAATAALGLSACGSGASTSPGSSAAADGKMSGEAPHQQHKRALVAGGNAARQLGVGGRRGRSDLGHGRHGTGSLLQVM